MSSAVLKPRRIVSPPSHLCHRTPGDTSRAAGPSRFTFFAMYVQEIAPRLWHWTAPHPDWKPSDFKDGKGWQKEVSAYSLVGEGHFLLFDPLIPEGEEQRFWEALDRDVEGHGPPAIMLTVFWHARSSQVIADRYDGATIWAHAPAAAAVSEVVRPHEHLHDRRRASRRRSGLPDAPHRGGRLLAPRPPGRRLWRQRAGVRRRPHGALPAELAGRARVDGRGSGAGTAHPRSGT